MIRVHMAAYFSRCNLGGTWFRADVGLFLNAPLIVAVDSRNPSHLLAPISDCSVRATVGSPGLLKRRPRRGKENRDAGRSLRTARGAARLHRPSGADRLRAPIAQLPEYVGAGDGACVHSGGYRDVLTDLPDMRDGFVYPMAGPGLGTAAERLTAADCQRGGTKA
jgi:hypothetical protein